MENRCYKIIFMQAIKKNSFGSLFPHISNNISSFLNVKQIDLSQQNFSKFTNSQAK